MVDGFEFNLGCVVYSVSSTEILGDWLFHKEGVWEGGTGKGLRLTEYNEHRPFEGEFDIVYTDETGNTSPNLRLSIEYASKYYRLTWTLDHKITDLGIGIEKDHLLSVSYTKAL